MTRLQIRTRYKTGSARLCASIVDPEAESGTFCTESTTVIVYTSKNGSTTVRTCTRTAHVSTGSSAIVSGATSLPDCGGFSEENLDPDDCFAHRFDLPATSVVTSPAVITYAGESATRDDVKSAAISAMAYGAWSDWVDFLSIDIDQGSSSGGFLAEYLAESSFGNNGLPGGGFRADAASHESELRVLGAYPLSIAVSEGPDITTAPVNYYVIAAGDSMGFSVGAPTTASDWVSDKAVLRCVCPVLYAPTA